MDNILHEYAGLLRPSHHYKANLVFTVPGLVVHAQSHNVNNY